MCVQVGIALKPMLGICSDFIRFWTQFSTCTFVFFWWGEAGMWYFL